jgi:hypothetical protein
VKACDKQLFGCEHVEDSFTGGDSLVLVVIHLKMPLRSLHGHYVLGEGIGSDHKSLAIAFDVESEQPRRMTSGIDSRNPGNHFVARLDEGRPVGQGYTYLYIQFSIEFPSFPYVFAAFPEIEICGAKDIAGFRKYRLAPFCQPANVVWMAMGRTITSMSSGL